MATTTDTLIFELKVKDDASKVFDAWDKKLANLAKEAQSSFKSISGSTTSIFSGMVGGVGNLLLSGFTSIFDGIVSLASAAFTKVSDFVMDVSKKSIDAFASYEKELALVSKTTGIAGEELKQFGNEIRDLAKPIGDLKAEDLLKVAQVAGQLGIQGKENIKSFAVEIGIGAIALDKFNGSTEKLGLAIAGQQKIFNLTANETRNMLSALAALSVSTESNELKISNFNKQMGQFQASMQLSFQEASAWGAALTSTMIAPEKAATQLGSAFNRLSTLGIESAIEILKSSSDEGAASLIKLEQITGKSRESFKSLGQMLQVALGKDSFATMNLIAGEFAKMEMSQEMLNKGFDKSKLGLDAFGAVGSKVMGLLGEQILSVEKATNTANQAFISGEEHIKQYEAQVNRAGAEFDKLDSIINDIYLTIGEPLLNAIGDLIKLDISPLVDSFADWLRNNEQAQAALNGIITGLKEIAQVVIRDVTAAFQELWGSLSQSDDVWETIKKGAEDLKNTVLTVFDSILSAFKQLKDVDWAEVFEQGGNALTFILDTVKSLAEWFKKSEGTLDSLKIAWETLKDTASDLNNFLEPFFDMFVSGFQNSGEVIEGVIDILASFVQMLIEPREALDTLWEGIKKVFGGLTGYVSSAIGAVGKLAGALSNVIGKIAGIAKEGWESSTFPEMQSWLSKNQGSVNSLNLSFQGTISKIAEVGAASASMGSQLARQMSSISTANISPAMRASLQEGLSRRQPTQQGSQPTQAEPVTRSSSLAQGGQAQGGAAAAGGGASLTINYNGQTIVDESTRDRQYRQISSGLSSISRRVVNG
jgi:TP901 family phage tail tape measure protein